MRDHGRLSSTIYTRAQGPNLRFQPMKKHLLFIVLFVVALTSRAFGFGFLGHQAIAETARNNLTPASRAQIIRSLGTDDLASVATWLDEVRAAGRNRGAMKGDVEAKDFVARFPDAAKWHYVNFPVGSTGYDPASPFATKDDVIHGIDLAIRTLEGSSTGMSPGEALRVLVHLVGDLHQPLHTVSGYYDLSNERAPRLLRLGEASPRSPTDAGGNALFFTKSQNLHEFFDSIALRKVSGGDYKNVAAVTERRQWSTHQKTAGDYHSWPKVWAGESMKAGSEALTALRLVSAETSQNKNGTLRLHRINVEFPQNFEAQTAITLSRQIGEGGLRLAELLNSLNWAK